MVTNKLTEIWTIFYSWLEGVNNTEKYYTTETYNNSLPSLGGIQKNWKTLEKKKAKQNSNDASNWLLPNIQIHKQYITVTWKV